MYRITCRRSRYSASRIRVPATACTCRPRGSCGRWRGSHRVDSTRGLPWPNPWNGSRWASSFASSRSRATESRVARPGRSPARNAWPSNGTDVLPGRAPESRSREEGGTPLDLVDDNESAERRQGEQRLGRFRCGRPGPPPSTYRREAATGVAHGPSGCRGLLRLPRSGRSLPHPGAVQHERQGVVPFMTRVLIQRRG